MLILMNSDKTIKDWKYHWDETIYYKHKERYMLNYLLSYIWLTVLIPEKSKLLEISQLTQIWRDLSFLKVLVLKSNTMLWCFKIHNVLSCSISSAPHKNSFKKAGKRYFLLHTQGK